MGPGKESQGPDNTDADSGLNRAEFPPRPAAQTAGVFALAWVFLRIGAMAFGGLGAALAIIEQELVERRKVLTATDVTESLTYTKLLPGSTVVQVVSYLGYKLGGWPGSAIATAAFVLPSAVIMIALAAAYIAATALPNIEPTINGLTAAVVGILLATTYRLGQQNFRNPLMLAITLAAFLTGAFLNINAALIVIAAGLLGIPFFSSSRGDRE